MGEGPTYREIVLFCTIILAFGVWFAAELGVPYGYWTNWPPGLQWLGWLLTGPWPRRGTGGLIAAVILLVGWLISRTMEKEDPAMEKKPPRWLFVLFCIVIWAFGVWIVFRWGLSGPVQSSYEYDWAASQAARAGGRKIHTILALLAVVGLAIAWIIFPRLRK